MKKELIALGYTFNDKDDLNNNEFTFLDSVTEDDEENSVLGNIRSVYLMTFRFRVKKLDFSKFNNDMRSLLYNDYVGILYPTIKDDTGIYFIDSYNVSKEEQENSFLIDVTFQIREK